MTHQDRLDPWGAIEIKDYNRLLATFGIKPFSQLRPLLVELEIPLHLYMRRGIIFGHRDLDIVMNEFKKGKRIAVLTGFMPSGRFHFGHKLTADQLIILSEPGIQNIHSFGRCRGLCSKKNTKRKGDKNRHRGVRGEFDCSRT